MDAETLNISKKDIHKLLCTGSGDGALLYLYLITGGTPEGAPAALQMSQSRIACASATLRQLGLWQDTPKTPMFSGEPPAYSEADVLHAMGNDNTFCSLYGEVQRQLGRSLNTEELKIILGFVNYLGLPPDVISVLVHYCRDRARQLGKSRNPSLRTIEKEAYRWAELGIDTMEEAAAYIQAQNQKHSRTGSIMQLLQIRGRNLTPGEDRFVKSWIEAGFDDDAISIAYERTCLNTGGLSWAYMNKILTRWQENGLLTGQLVRSGDRKPAPKGAVGQLGDAELEAIRQLMKEG